ncbi:aldehyde dehydrogenase (NADP(+)) [Nocardia sp. NPDC048505]|uniref:aldehyde dehydrogenase (NADP(+)) n=1 Tax=unclassified Nocardia TaxID=2637762 RepID=UPI00340F9690
MSSAVWSVDARTGDRRDRVAIEADASAVDAAVRAADATLSALADRTRRALFLRTAADELDAHTTTLAALADAETALGLPRLHGEIARTSAQLRAFAEVVTRGEYLDIIIDHADPEATPPRPDLRRFKIPLGVVAVYSASNFPFAFSVAGGDTASALAAGCPVVVKAHPDHPATSEAVCTVLRSAAERCAIPADVVQVVHGFDAGLELVRHPLIAAAGFTGSIRGGRALFDAAAARPVPIPFHGELGSLNPVVVTGAAATERAERLGTELAGSVTLGTGQFCVKPGLVFVPSGPDGDHLLTALAKALTETAPGTMLDERMRANFVRGVAERAALPEVAALVTPPATGRTAPAALLTTTTTALATGAQDLLLEECFGPVTVAVRYPDFEAVAAVLTRLSGNLTATIQLADEDLGDPGTSALLDRLRALAGRLVINQWPTGVAVAGAQHHGGPYPATTSTSTSVGATAIERWLRPVVYQNTPDPLLPPELRAGNPTGLPRRVDGRSTTS